MAGKERGIGEGDEEEGQKQGGGGWVGAGGGFLSAMARLWLSL